MQVENRNLVLVLFIFMLGVLSVPLVCANSSVDSWYRIGYNYSQKGHNEYAFVWMMRAAKEGYAAAQNNIGLSYLHGLGVSKNKNKAFNWFEKSAKQGFPYAQSELAMLYYQQSQKKQAHQWWLAAANSNDEYAQFNLASLLLEQNNPKKAYYWLQRARNNKHPQAQVTLDKLRERYNE